MHDYTEIDLTWLRRLTWDGVNSYVNPSPDTSESYNHGYADACIYILGILDNENPDIRLGWWWR